MNPTTNLENPLEILKRLIAIPSVNPMGRPHSSTLELESRITEFLTTYFDSIGFEWECQEVTPGRCNVLARLPGHAPTVLLDAHQDTVPVEGMTVPPFTPTVRDGRVYGRGSCDVKGGLAAMLAAAARLAHDRPDNRANIVIACTCDEELNQTGAKYLCDSWSSEQSNSRLLPCRPNFTIVAEPTELNVVVAHKGTVRWRIQTCGRASHSSDPSRGVNAVYQMARIVSLLEEYAQKLPTQTPPHPLCGYATLSVGTILGGTSVNVVPDRCEIQIDRRLLPGESPETAVRDVDQFLRQRLDFNFVMHPPDTIGLSLEEQGSQVWATKLLDAVTQVVSDRRCVGVSFGTHAARYSAHGVPSLVFGPGSIAQAHTQDEWLEIEQLEQATEVLYRFLMSLA